MADEETTDLHADLASYKREIERLKAEVRAAMSEQHADEIERITAERKALPDEERRRVEAADAPLLRIQLAALAEQKARLEATIDRVRAVHHLTEWVSLSDVCGRHHWFRTVEPCAENIAVADICPDCRPRRYMNCVCADDECPVLAALDEPKEELWTAAGIETP